MKDFLRFLRTKTFFIHFTLASISALLILWLAFKMMGVYTDHGEVVTVPDFTGKNISELDKFIEDKGITYRIIDSIYNPEEKPGIVLSQDPLKDASVKKDRTIYLYVTSVLPPQITMPKLIDRSLRQATAMIESYGLKVGKTKFVADPCSNCILKQQSEGKDIEPGTPIKKGTVIDLVVGKGSNGSEQIAIVDVTGITYCQAKSKLLANGLSIGALILDAAIKDTCSAFVYRQSPMGGGESRVSMGASIDLYITNDKSKLELLKTNSTIDGDGNTD